MPCYHYRTLGQCLNVPCPHGPPWCYDLWMYYVLVLGGELPEESYEVYAAKTKDRVS